MTFAALLAAMIVFAHLFGAQRDRGWVFFSVACGLVFITPITVASYGAGRTGGVGERDGVVSAYCGDQRHGLIGPVM